MVFCSILVCLSVFYSKHVLVYICLSSSSGRGKSIDDQVLDLALMTNYSQSTFMWTVASLLSVLSGLVIQYSFVAKLTVPQFCPVRDSAERKLSHFRQVPKFFPVVEHLLELCFSFCFPFSRPVGLGRSPRFSGSSRCGLKAAQLPSYQDFSFSLGPRRTR